MIKQIFVNVPVKDLNKSIAFFTHLGFTFNKQFTNENATCMILSDNIMVMLLVEPFFQSFIKKDICNTGTANEAILCLSVNSRKEVDDMIKNAAAAGGKILEEPQDHGWMYGQSFSDLDGHLWEITYIDAAAVPENPGA